MPHKEVVPGVYAIPLAKAVNAYLLDGGDGLTLIDTGTPGSDGKILEAVRAIGRTPGDVRRILVTHCHADHSGSLAALKRATGAPAYMHAADAAMVREGRSLRPVRPAPGLLPGVFYAASRVMARFGPRGIEPAAVEHEIGGGDELDFAGGIRAFHAPGHCAGQLVFLWPRHGGVLFAADVAGNMRDQLGLSIVYEDLPLGLRTLSRISAMEFEVACFGHGRPIVGGAAGRFREKWPPSGPA